MNFRLLFLLMLLRLPFMADAQTPYQWTWVNGPQTVGNPGVYGTQGEAGTTNVPSARYEGVTWTTPDGKLWLFGGGNSTASSAFLSDLWVYDPVTGQWTWKKGSSAINTTGIYGTQGLPGVSNNPGGRVGANSWVGLDGRLWLFGGYGRDGAGEVGLLNDLWRYEPATGEWTWIKGSNLVNRNGIYGVQGNSATANTPGGRNNATSWRDSQGRLWLFGGSGYPASGSDNRLNDLWRYDPATNQWTWINGSNSTNAKGVYGTQGTAAAANMPGSRIGSTAWSDAQGRFWLFGGSGYNAFNAQGELDDLWRFDPVSVQWTWIKGSNLVNQFGVYGSQNVAAPTNSPGARHNSAFWRDAQGRFWMYGGIGYQASGVSSGALADLWRYEPDTNLWAWIGGSSQSALYGIQGQATDRTRPGAK
ncbi:MAG: Kelch repeat type 2-containing protein, partial [Chthoniobacteraceae bacterium]|nr:Kelch repeat type 2-containing protein [Chthoniobacteraceae bacterium]